LTGLETGEGILLLKFAGAWSLLSGAEGPPKGGRSGRRVGQKRGGREGNEKGGTGRKAEKELDVWSEWGRGGVESMTNYGSKKGCSVSRASSLTGE